MSIDQCFRLRVVILAFTVGMVGVVSTARAACPLSTTFADGAVYTQTLHVATTGSDFSGNGSEVNPYQTISKAAQVATPGTKIVVHEGNYGYTWISNLQGTSSAPIMITGADGEGLVTIDRNYAGGECMHLVDPKYVVLANMTLREATDNGLNIDDGGTYATPADYVVLDNLTIENIGTGGNNDGIKLSGVNHIRIINCRILGTNAGSGIDMVGCHDSEIVFNEFRNGGSNATQTKGGSENILIYGNLMVNAGYRAIQFGGSTGDAFFRPIDATFEGANMQAIANCVVGSEAAIAYVSAINCVAYNNTIYTPTNWIARILNENTSRDWPEDGEFINNIVVFNTAQIGSTFINVGSNTYANTWTFANNLWYALDNPSFSGPNLPAPETNAVIQQNPLLANPGGEDFHIPGGSPAQGAGIDLAVVTGDRDEICYLSPPAIGAYEVPLPLPTWVASTPPHNGTLAKRANNVIELEFDATITLPAGPPVHIEPVAGGTDLANAFAFAVGPGNVTLICTENGEVLTNQTWYRLTPTAAFAVQAFEVDLCILIGDADGNGRVMAVDLGVIWGHNGETTDARYDIDGNGRVMAVDLGVAWGHNGQTAPPKP